MPRIESLLRGEVWQEEHKNSGRSESFESKVGRHGSLLQEEGYQRSNMRGGKLREALLSSEPALLIIMDSMMEIDTKDKDRFTY